MDTELDRWPALPLAAWADTYATLHMWTQIVGKIRLALAPPVNHWWHVSLDVSPRGLTTRAMGDYLRYKSTLPARLSEFVIIMTARRWTQQYEWNAHQPLALKGGLNADIVKAIAEGRRPERMAEDEDVLYTLGDELQRNQSVSDATYARAVAKLGEQGVIDAIGITGYYTMLAMVLNTARTPIAPGTKPALAPFPR